MGKTGRWIKNFLTGKKERGRKASNNHQISTSIGNGVSTDSNPPPTTPKEKRRWSFRRSSAAIPVRPESNSDENMATTPPKMMDQLHITLLNRTINGGSVSGSSGRAAAAIKIQSCFRAYLARKALSALKGLVKLQALVRGHLVRKQAATTLRCMEALVNLQARARAQRLQMAEEIKLTAHWQFNLRKSTHGCSNQAFDRGNEENIKVVEMDAGDSKPITKLRNRYLNHTSRDKTPEHRVSTHRVSIKQERPPESSPLSSAITDTSPRTCSNHFKEYWFSTTQSSPHCHSSLTKPDQSRLTPSYPKSECGEPVHSEYSFYPNYMANTESSKAKVRSHSAPKQRPFESFERQHSRRRISLEGRNVPRAVRMQRSSSQVGSAAPWPVKLDRSNISLKESECGSTSTLLSNVNLISRSRLEFDVPGIGY